MRAIFMGTPDFAVPSLVAVHELYEVLAVFTQPDSKAGRGRRLQAPPVKIRALELGIPTYQPSSLKDYSVQSLIESLAPEFIIVVAYGKILPPSILQIPKVAAINVHASLLPRWRGAAPIEAAILNGDKATGISIMQMEEGLDTGPVFCQESVEILPEETAGELSARLSILGANNLVQTLPAILSNELQALGQNDAQATYAPMIKKADGQLNFERPAAELSRQVRAFEPWPGSYFLLRGQRIVVRRSEAVDAHGGIPGTCLVYHGLPAIASRPGILLLHSLQPAGKRELPGKIYLNGAKDFIDGRITYTPHAQG